MSIESKLRSFVTFAKAKLDLTQAELEDEDPEDNFQEQCQWMYGFSRTLKSVGGPASQELKAAIAQELAVVWDMKTERPGENLREGGVEAIRNTFDALIAGPLAGEEEEEEATEEDSSFKPDNLADMTIQDAVTYMWDVLDKGNRVDWGEEGFILDLQNKGSYGRDRCSQPLFTHVNKAHPFWSSPVTTAFIRLLDNYEREVGEREVVTSGEKREMAEFMHALARSPVIRFLLEYLKVHGKDPRCQHLRTMNDLENLLYDIWLTPYRRRNRNDSSGFEHVFVGEEKNGKITGLHNWVQYYMEEQAGRIDYLGWKGMQDSDYSDDVNIVTVMFSWEDDDEGAEIKPCSTILCGSSVEFEMALLSLCFLAAEQEGHTPLTLGSEAVQVTCYPQKVRGGGPKIGTAFVELVYQH